MRRLASIAVIAALSLAAILYVVGQWGGAPAEGAYRLAKAESGEVIATVSATGPINPVATVIVGSQLSGQVVEILADYNSQVKADQVVARLNSDQIRAKHDAARADLEQMRANRLVQQGMIEKVKAETEKARATQMDVEAQVVRNEALLGDSERIFQRQSELRSRGFAAEQAFDTARTTRDAHRPRSIRRARRSIPPKPRSSGSPPTCKWRTRIDGGDRADRATRSTGAADRGRHSQFRNQSPVDGVVVQRNVELGQTVASSLQSPTLFLIADDLRRMEIAANIDETDVGRIKPGQRVTFTVTAYPGRTFEGSVKQVRLGSQTVANVVIYTTIVSIENPRLELLPGMTANLRIETDRRENVVRIPNAALRWRPPSIVPEATPASAPDAAQSARGGNGAMRITEFVEAVKTELNLTAAQMKDVDAAIADMRKSLPVMPTVTRIRRGANAAALRGRTWKTASPLCSTPSSVRNSTRSRSASPRKAAGAPRRSAASSSPARMASRKE